MSTRTLVASVLPRARRLPVPLPGWRALALRIVDTRERSLRMQERADAARTRSVERHGYASRR